MNRRLDSDVRTSKFKIVRQPPNSCWCGLACVASVLGMTTYEEAKLLADRAGIPEMPGSLGYRRWALAALLEAGGRPGYKVFSYAAIDRHERIAEATQEDDGTIVYVRTNDRYGHYLLKTEEGWMDPLVGEYVRELPGEPTSAIRAIRKVGRS